jgi:hypothetical protein
MIFLLNPQLERESDMKKKDRGNYIVQIRYLGETVFRHYGFGTSLSELIHHVKELQDKNKYTQYRIIDLDTKKAIYFQ